MSTLADKGQERKFRIGFSGHSGIQHIIDDWAPEFVRRRHTVALCGSEVHPQTHMDQPDRLCMKCAQAVYRLERELYNRKNNPPEEAIISCLNYLREQSQPKLAKVIPLIPRRRSS
jgi:hypothetical protein